MLYMNSLGRFELTDGKNRLNDETIRSEKLTKLLLYLLLHRDHNLSVEELAEALWQENETENPTGALKNLMYRLRTLLKEQFGDQRYIITSRGAYNWNTDIEVQLDVEELEHLYEQVRLRTSSEQKIADYERIISIYKGEFVPNVRDMHWVTTLSTYYHSIFLNAVKGLAQLYWEREQFSDLERITVNGIQYENADEELYSYQIQALAAQHKTQMAEETYQKAQEILFQELGVRTTKELEKVHQAVCLMQKSQENEELEQVRESLDEERITGAYLCGYPLFREIYRVETRQIGRRRKRSQLLLFSIDVKQEEKRIAITKREQSLRESRKDRNVTQAMKTMEEILVHELRVGDVVSRYSEKQYIVLLTECERENVERVKQRILSRFREEKEVEPCTQVRVELEEISGTIDYHRGEE